MKKQWRLILICCLLLVVVVIVVENVIHRTVRVQQSKVPVKSVASQTEDTLWHGRSEDQIPIKTDSGKLILYGYNLIANTSFYLGPKGTVAHISNGMNCQNCHLKGGTLPYANNFGKVYSTYPQFRARNDKVESIYDRINDCFERSLNGKAMDTSTNEMEAIYAYMKWLGQGVHKGFADAGTGVMKLKYLDTAANPLAGRAIYVAKCQTCHGKDGQGVLNDKATGYIFPPLWGKHSYNDGAGLYRLGNFSSFIKNNMPFGTDYHKPLLSDEEAWDVAAFVNSQPRPHKNQSLDWKNISEKPFDFPFGPYIDSFTAKQHKYGPFKPTVEAIQNRHI